MHLTIFIRAFFSYRFNQILENDVILMNYGSFFQKKDSFSRIWYEEMRKKVRRK